jgi:ribosomal protein L21E
MLRREPHPTFVIVDDPRNVWHGRTGEIVDHEHDAVWWRDHLTGTRVRFPHPTP